MLLHGWNSFILREENRIQKKNEISAFEAFRKKSLKIYNYQSLFIHINTNKRLTTQPPETILSTKMSAEFKTVLIAGATGSLGEKITNAFLDKNLFEVRVAVRKTNEKTEKFKARGAKIVEVDFSNVESLKKVSIYLYYIKIS